MKINDILRESSAEGSNDYQQMMDMVRGNPMPGVPPEQRVALALFKELQKQKQHNAELDSELDAAEQRIDQATSSGELQGQELGMHRGELERERTRGTQQKASIDQLGQTYAKREEASEQQVKELSDKLEAVKSIPGVNQDSVDKLEKQINDLKQTGIGADKVEALERSITAIQQAESTDDAAIKDLIVQIQDAQAATQELKKAGQSLKKDADQTVQAAVDAVEQMKQDLARLNVTTGYVQSNITDVIPQRLGIINQKIAELENENEDQFNELIKHEDWLKTVAPDAEPSDSGALAPARDQFSLPGVAAEPVTKQLNLPGVDITAPAPSSVPVNPAAAAIARQAAQQKAKLGQSYGIDTTEPEPVAESAFKRSVAWATGKSL